MLKMATITTLSEKPDLCYRIKQVDFSIHSVDFT